MLNLANLILIPLIVTGIIQVLKLVTDFFKTGQIDWHKINEYGGMPSGHTAIVTSFACIVGIIEGLSSTAFAIALILMIVVIRDAMGLRQHLADQAKTIELILKKYPLSEGKTPKLYTQIGHSFLEVAVSFFIAAALTFALYWVFAGI